MVCKCGIAARVEAGGVTEHDGEKYQVQAFVCVNPRCPFHGRIIGAHTTKIEKNLETEWCHGHIISVGGHQITECPDCGKKGGEGK